MNIKNLKMIPCIKCGADMPELRKTQYGYKFCVNCSTVETVVGKTMTYGSGDHTWNDIIIMDRSTARKLAEAEARQEGKSYDPDLLADDSVSGSGAQSLKDNIKLVLNPDDYVQDNSPAKEEKSILDDLIKEKPNG